MWRVIVADDHPVVCAGLKRILQEYDDITVCAEAGSGAELYDCLFSYQHGGAMVHAMIMDEEMPDRSTIEIIKHVKKLAPSLGILILGMKPPDPCVIRWLRCGASGYLTKGEDPDMFVSAVRAVSAGRRFLTPEVSEMMAAQLCSPIEEAGHERLSDREYDIFCMLAFGESVKEIGTRLCISSKTVNAYRRKILTKMSFSHDADITQYAIANRIID